MKTTAFWCLPLLGFALGRYTLPAPSSSALPPIVPTEPLHLDAAHARSPSSPTSRAPGDKPTATASLLAEPSTSSSPASRLTRLVAWADRFQSFDLQAFTAFHRDWHAFRIVREPGLRELLFERWVSAAPAAGAALACAHWDEYSLYLKTWMRRDPVSALAWLDTHQAEYPLLAQDRELRGDLLSVALPPPGQLPPLEALAKVRHLFGSGATKHPEFDAAVARIIGAWAEQDSSAAWTAATQTTDSPAAQASALSAVLQRLIATAPTRTRQLFDSISDQKIREGVTSSLAYHLVTQRGIDAARQFTLSLPAGGTRDAAYRAVSAQLFRTPQEAGPFLLSLPPADLQHPAIFRDVFALWFSTDPAAASIWITSQADPASRSELASQLTIAWSQRSPEAAAHWIESLPSGPTRVQATESFARRFISTNPDDALLWLHTLPPGPDRTARLQRVWQHWPDRSAARAWRSQASSLTPDERSALDAAD